jgi:DNA-binding LacI/PurR family transcriptional regulator
MKKAGGGKPGRVTIREVAADAGVSVAAVSKVLREAYGVSEAMRTRVRSSMSKLGYRPNTAARGMRGQTFTLGVLFPDMRNPFFADILTGVNSALERTQYQALIGVNHVGPTYDDALIDSMIDRQMDGLIFIGATDQEQLLEIARRKPLVTVGNHAPDNLAYDTVNGDDQAGGRLVVRHLAGNGYRRIAMLSLLGGSTILAERELGYRREMLEQGLGEHITIVHARQTLREVQAVARRLLEGPEKPEAIFCWTDFIALEVIGVATELGLRIPEDLAIVGYDNTVYCELAQNNLTSIDQSGELLGMQATRLLVERIKGRAEAEHFMVTPRIVARGSSRRTKG